MTPLPASAPDRFEHVLRKRGYRLIAGVDEAGRGCLAGPVVAAAVILPESISFGGIVDSKLLSGPARDEAAALIQQEAVCVGVGMCSPEEIDRLNILWASMEAMRRAVDRLDPTADFLLIDGNRTFGKSRMPARAIVKGDRRSRSVAAASVIAKVTRDRIMIDLHEAYPEYGWNRHKGYPTRMHYQALDRYGPSPIHRRSFRLTSSGRTAREPSGGSSGGATS